VSITSPDLLTVRCPQAVCRFDHPAPTRPRAARKDHLKAGSASTREIPGSVGLWRLSSVTETRGMMLVKGTPGRVLTFLPRYHFSDGLSERLILHTEFCGDSRSTDLRAFYEYS